MSNRLRSQEDDESITSVIREQSSGEVVKVAPRLHGHRGVRLQRRPHDDVRGFVVVVRDLLDGGRC